MALIQLPPKFSIPELIIPGRRPIGLVELDRELTPSSLAGFWLLNSTLKSLTGFNNFKVITGSSKFVSEGIDFIDNFGSVETFGSRPRMEDASELTIVLSITIRNALNNIYCGVDLSQLDDGAWNLKALTNKTLAFFKDNTTSNVTFSFANNTIIENVPTTYVFRWSNNDTGTLWRNDGYYEQVIDSTPGTFLPEISTSEFYLGNFDGISHCAQIYAEALPDALCKSLVTNPYQFLKPLNGPLYFPVPDYETFTIPDKKKQGSWEGDESAGVQHRLKGDFYLTDYPVTMGCWFKDTAASSTNDRTLIQITDTASLSDYIRLGKSDNTDRSLEASGRWSGATFQVALTGNLWVQNTWGVGIGRFTSSTSIESILNNGFPALNSVEHGVPSGVNEIAIGWENDSTPGDPWEGLIAHVFVYKGLMTDAQYTRFRKGELPDEIFGHDLSNLFYLPLQENLEHVGGFNSNTIMRFESATSGVLQFQSDHPPVQFKKKSPLQILYEPKEALDGFVLPDSRFEAPELLIPGRKPTSLVEIDTENQLGKGITACWLLTEGVGTFKDLSGTQQDGTVGSAIWMISNLGNMVLNTNSANYATIPNYTPDDIGSCIFKFKHDDITGSQRYLGFHDAFEVGIAAGNRVRNQFYQASGILTEATTVLSVSVWYTAVCTWNRTSNTAKIYINGILETTTANANDTPTGTPAVLTIGNRTGSVDGDAFDGDFEFIIFKDYEIDDSEAMDWSDNPYQFLIPA